MLLGKEQKLREMRTREFGMRKDFKSKQGAHRTITLRGTSVFTVADSRKVSEHFTPLPGSSREFVHWLRPAQFGISRPSPACPSVQLRNHN